ncbi:ralf-like 33 [Perilla frutescens var. frutescens]|nr:ralf-like 33 [Perilla frutescens var. frutescens]
MVNSSLLRLLLIPAAVLASALLLSTAVAGGDFGWIPPQNPSACRGSIAECMGGGGGEFDMDSESNRRMLATSDYISYGALQADTVPCSRSGASYYNCQPGGEANPYTRSCSAATQCRTS